jgi:hypothetical protein
MSAKMPNIAKVSRMKITSRMTTTSYLEHGSRKSPLDASGNFPDAFLTPYQQNQTRS